MNRSDLLVEEGQATRRGDSMVVDGTGDDNFFRCYNFIEQQSIEWVREQLLKLGQWPAERIVVRVLDWEEAVSRLSDDAQSMLAMTRMIVAVEDADRQLYLVRTPDLVTGVHAAHRSDRSGSVRTAVNEAFKTIR